MGQVPVRPAARGKKQIKKAGGCPAGGKSMKSCENFVSDKSQYFIYSPSKTARDIFLYPLQCGRFLYEPGIRTPAVNASGAILTGLPPADTIQI